MIWSIERDRSWAYFNRGLVYLALLRGRGCGSGRGREWAYVSPGARAAARLGAARGRRSRGRFVRARRATELADRVLERARAAVRDGGAARALAGGPARARALAASGGRGLLLRAGGRADSDVLARRCARRGCRGRAVARARDPAGRERCGAAARRRRRARGRGLGVLAPGLAADGQSHSVRAHDGAWFAVVFVLAALAVAAVAYLGSLGEERRPLDDRRRRLVGQVALGVLVVGVAAAAVGVVVETKPKGWFQEFTAQPTNAIAAGRPAAPGERQLVEPLALVERGVAGVARAAGRGTGAGTFDLTHRLLRTNNIVVTEPHNVPLQFLSETGSSGSCCSWGSSPPPGPRSCAGCGGRDRGRRRAGDVLAAPTCCTRSSTSTGTSSRSAGPSSSLGALLGGGWCGTSRARGWRCCRRSRWRLRSRC